MTKKCGARTRDGDGCKNPPCAGSDTGRCRMHGGKTPRGVALPQFRHGRYSKAIPPRLLAAFEASLRDPDALALTRELALVDSRLDELLAHLDTGESGGLWLALHGQLSAMRAASARKDMTAFDEAYGALANLIDRGAEDELIWREIAGLIDRRARLVDQERRRSLDEREFMRRDEVLALVSAVAYCVRSAANALPGALRADFLTNVQSGFASTCDRVGLPAPSDNARERYAE